jgi:hypothetical protein
MATIDPSIALGIKPIQLESPVNQFAKAQDVAVNALKMQEYQRGLAEENALRELVKGGLDLGSPEAIRKMYEISPKQGMAFEKQRFTLNKERAAADKQVADLEAQLVKNARDTLGVVNDQATYDIWRQQAISKLPGLAQIVPTQFTPQNKTALMLEADKYIQQTQLSEFQKQNLGIQREGQRLQYDPTTQANIAGAKKRAETDVTQEVQGQADVKANRKALATAGYDPVTGKDNISKLIQDSTGSFAGAGTDLAGRLIGVSTKGAQAISQLKTFESKLTQDILGGKLGAGISNTDREFIVQAIGEIANSTLPVETRQAAWNAVKERMRVAGMVEAPQSNINVPGLPQVNVPGGSAAPAAKPSLDDIFKPKK